jgi:hypothetical protein
VPPTEVLGPGYPFQVLSRSVGFENPTPRLPGFPLLSLTQGMFCHSDTAFSKMLFYLIDQNYQGTAKYPQNSNSAQD